MQLHSLDSLIEQQDHSIRVSKYQRNINPDKIPIRLGGGIGDVIMNTAIIDSLKEYGNVEIYTKHADVYNYFTSGRDVAKPVSQMPHYTWWLDICGVVSFQTQDGFIGFLKGAYTLWKRQRELFLYSPEMEIFVKNHPVFDNGMCRWAREKGLDRRSFPFFTIGAAFKENEKKPRVEALKYITIHDGFELASGYAVKGRATKQWKWTHWNTLVKAIKERYPDYEIIQLGAETARPIDGVDVNLISQTKILEAFDIISKSSLHIDGDSGLAHAATHLSVPCVTMFGPTPQEFYGYKENINLRTTTCKEACFWLKRDWLSQCPIGHNAPKCMDDLDPEVVLEAVASIL